MSTDVSATKAVMDLGSSRTSGQIDTETGPKTSASRASHPDKMNVYAFVNATKKKLIMLEEASPAQNREK